jgi:hypothetical protein
VQESLRLLLTKNGIKLYEQQETTTAVSYTRHASDRVVLSSNMSSFQEADLGDINSTNLGQHLMVVSDRAVTIAVNTTSQYISADTLMMVNTSVSHLYFKNTDANKLARVSYVVTD